MQTFSPDRHIHRGRTHRKRHESAALSPAFAAAAAFVAATAFSALGALPVSADQANAVSTPATTIARSMPEVPRVPLNLQIGKMQSLILPDDATYALTDIEGRLLAGSALEQNSGNKLLRVMALNGLLQLEGTHEGRAFLSIEAPRQSPQYFAVTISKRMVLPDATTIPAQEMKPAPATAADIKPALSLISPELSRAATTPASPVSPTVRLTDHDASATRLLLSRIPSVAKPVIARTSALAQVAPVRTVPLSPIAPPLPTLESNEGVTAPPAATALAASAPPLPTGLAPLETPTVLTPGTNSTTSLNSGSDADLAAQISPNVPAPAALPAVRIPYRTQASLPDDIARAANDPTSRRPQLTVARGMARILAFRENILAVFFSDENVMDARAINARTLAVTGKGSGRSTLAVMLARTPDDVVGRAVIYNIDVYSPDAPQVVQVPEPIGFTDPVAARQAIETAINDPRVTVSVIQRPDGALVARLTGSLRDRSEIEAIATTARLFVPEVISSLYSDTGALTLPEALGNARFSNEGILQTKLRGILNNDSIVITALPGGTTLTATVDSAGEAEAILGILPYLDRKIQPIIVVRGAPAASKYYNPERPILFGEDYEMTRRLNEVTGLDSVYAVRTARNALAIYGTVRDRSEYDRLRRYSLLLPQLQEAAASSQSSTTTAAPGTPNAVTNSSAAVTTSVSAAAPALSAAAGVAPVASTRDLTGLRGSNMPIGGYEYPTQIQMFVRILDENAAAVRLVTVESSVVEIQRDALRDLGVQFGSVGLLSESITPGTPATTVSGPNGVTSTGATPSVITRTIDPTFNQGAFLGGNGFIGTGGFSNINPIRARVAALYQKGAARVLSNPNLTAIEGSEAQITIGGSRPVPSTTTTAAAGGSNQTSVEFRRFGIILTMRPTVADDDTIILQVRGDVTDLDFTTSISLGGAVIPGERVRSVDTTVTMREGDTLVLGGLITNEYRKQTSKVPFLGDLPFIGKLFQSKRFENNETELAIFLTPSIRRQAGSENLREIIQANPSFPKLPGLQEDTAFGLSTVDGGN